MNALPRRAADLPSALLSISDLQDAERARLAVDVKTFDFNFAALSSAPIEIRSSVVSRARVVLLGGVWLKSDPATPLLPTGFHWRPGTDRGVVLFDGISGLALGYTYTATIEIKGDR